MRNDSESIDRISACLGKTSRLLGWVANRRSSGKIRFLQLRDGTGVIQCVVMADRVSPEVFELADHIPYESSVIVTGEVQKDPRSPVGFEIAVDNIEVISEALPYPISKKDHGVAFLMDHRHLWLRSSRQNVLMKIRSVLTRSA